MAELVVRDGDDVTVAARPVFRARFRVEDVDGVDGIGKTALLAGIGVHGWGGHWTVNWRRSPAARITLRRAVRARILGVPIRVRTLDLAPVDVEQLRRELAGRG